MLSRFCRPKTVGRIAWILPALLVLCLASQKWITTFNQRGELQQLIELSTDILLRLVESFTSKLLWACAKQCTFCTTKVQVLHLCKGEVEEVALGLNQLVPVETLGFKDNWRRLVREACHLEGLHQGRELRRSLAWTTALHTILVESQQ